MEGGPALCSCWVEDLGLWGLWGGFVFVCGEEWTACRAVGWRRSGKKRKDDLGSVRGVRPLVCGGFCRVWRWERQLEEMRGKGGGRLAEGRRSRKSKAPKPGVSLVFFLEAGRQLGLSHQTSRRFINIYMERTDFWHLVLLRKNILYKESPPSITVTRNPNWSSEILWLGIGYVKGKILSPLKRSVWGRLHCWFCLKLLSIYSLMLWWFVYNILDSGASEYSSSNNSNFCVGKNS